MKLILGSMTFGGQVNRETAKAMIDSYLESGNNEIDTAHIYCDGKTETMDGPFAETKERLGGYYLLDCKDLDQAIEMAALIPTARFGTVELRPIMQIPGDG